MPAAVYLRSAAVAVPGSGFSTIFRIGIVTLLTLSAVVTISPTSVHAADVVLDAASGTRAGAFVVVNDNAAAGGNAAALPNKARAKVITAVAAPADYLELTFTADANTPYHLWVRMRAENNSYANDSIHVQFTNVVTGAIGTTSSQVVNLEDASEPGVAGTGGRTTAMAPAFSALTSCSPEPARNGCAFRIAKMDSSSTNRAFVRYYLRKSPGALKNDQTGCPTARRRRPSGYQPGPICRPR